MIEKILSKVEIWFVLKLIGILAEGCYYLRYASSEDFEKCIKVRDAEEEFDGLVYRRTVRGTYGGKLIQLHVWSCGISIVRCWIEWM